MRAIPLVSVLAALAFAAPARTAAGAAPEIGANDFRLSDMGGTGDAAFDASSPAVAYNSLDDEYLVVWGGDDNVGGLVDGELEIFGQRVDAATGLPVGANDFRISDMRDTGTAGFNAWPPAVAYNSFNHEYLVVWPGDDNVGGLAPGEREIFAQRLDASTGAEVGTNDFRISDMGGIGNTSFDAFGPAVAYNSANNEYLVVWSGSDNVGGLVQGEFEVFGQRLNAATGAEVGANDFRISDMGGTGNTDFFAERADVAYNSLANEYLVVWESDDDVGGLVDDEHEIFGQRLNAATGTALGANDFRISDMGGTGFINFAATIPAVAYNANDNEYLVVWSGDELTLATSDDEFEIWGQRLDGSTGAAIGSNDFRISTMGSAFDSAFDAFVPGVACNPSRGAYLVVWSGDTDLGGTFDDEFEIWGQYLDPSGVLMPPNGFRTSDMGGTGQNPFGGFGAVPAYAGGADDFLAVWYGDDDVGGLVDEENEIFGQRLLGAAPLFADGFESGDTSMWSATTP